MSWVFEHLNIILVVAGVIAYWLNQRAREKAGQEADYDGDGVPEARELRPESRDGEDPDQAERTRRIQEEIRRKIAERRGQAAPPPMPAEDREAPPALPRLEDLLKPVFQETPPPMPREREPVSPPPPPIVREVVMVSSDQETLERQRRLEEQLAELEAQRREARRRAQQAFESGTGAGGAALATATSGGATLGVGRISAELRDPRALRRAIVLREVLGAPVALR